MDNKKLLEPMYGAFNVIGVVIDVALALALFPLIKGFIADVQGNMTSTELLMANLIPLFIIIALVLLVLKQTGVIKSTN